jgi:hypothetical protein
VWQLCIGQSVYVVEVCFGFVLVVLDCLNNFIYLCMIYGARGSVVVKALRY